MMLLFIVGLSMMVYRLLTLVRLFWDFEVRI